MLRWLRSNSEALAVPVSSSKALLTTCNSTACGLEPRVGKLVKRLSGLAPLNTEACLKAPSSEVGPVHACVGSDLAASPLADIVLHHSSDFAEELRCGKASVCTGDVFKVGGSGATHDNRPPHRRHSTHSPSSSCV